MALWELDEFTSPQFLGYTRAIPDPPPFLGTQFLPDETTFDIEVSYIKGANNQPVMAHIITWDAEAPIGSKPPLGDKISFELPPIKRKERLSEKELVRFLQPRVGTDDERRAIDSVYAVTDRLVAGVKARVEWLRMQALSEDTISYNESGVEIAFDFGYNAALQLDVSVDANLSTYWTDHALSDPIADLQYIKTLYRTETGGFEFERLVLSADRISDLLMNDNIRTLVRGTGAPTQQLAVDELAGVFARYGLPILIPYDAKVYSESDAKVVSTLSPLDPAKSIGLPSFQVGSTLWGPTAESRALFGTPLASEAPGLIVQTYAKDDPPAEWVKAVATAFPSVPEADRVVQLTLTA
ncbi:MAG: hypothetical protein DRJ50_09715 [Actinobacteria bacterium]|nr:MAG: hypothetical protein DRJ50_09715 [Actinomycetota bacterium]